MCRCCQECLESCYWHLIEERFCFDPNIATYEEPAKKDEKNNNMFDNMAFYDSVSVIAGRAIVTIDPIPAKEDRQPIIVQQPRRLTQDAPKAFVRSMSKSVPVIYEDKAAEASSDEEHKPPGPQAYEPTAKALSTSDVSKRLTLLDPKALEDSPNRKKSLRERRMSKSLYLKIDQHKEVPIIRQQSMPKFYLDTPEENQSDPALCRVPSTVLTSPRIKEDFEYDLYSVVQLEKSKSFTTPSAPAPVHHKEQSKRFQQIKERMKLRKTKSTANASGLLNQGSGGANPSSQ